jgi:hypothetical protein
MEEKMILSRNQNQRNRLHGFRKDNCINQLAGRGPRLNENSDRLNENKDRLKENSDVALGTAFKRHVTFYFTNFPAHMSNFYLRKGFEVCGILEDVYVARKRNRLGEPYGFVKFSNVRDVDKMTKALNAVWFGQFRVRASVAKFDRNAPGAERRVEEKQVSLSKGVGEKQDGHKTITRQATSQGGDLTTKQKEAEPVGGSTGTLDSEKEGSGVHVGDIVLNLENFKRQDVQSDGVQHLKKHVPKDSALPSEAAKGKESCSMFLRNYRSKPEDTQWANKGLVATVNNGEAIPVVETRISDAGFSDLVIIPMGADKVFICREGGDALDTVGGAVGFFNLVFSNWTRWEKDGRPYQRGAWVRLYGVPLNAWNVDFFKLCVFDCGRFIRADSCSAERDRLDFARVLIATSDLSIVNRVERVLVDGIQVDIKIVEEWGYAMGEDTCLFEEEDDSETSRADEDAAQDEPEIGRNVDLLVEHCVGVEEGEEGVIVKSQNGDMNNNASAIGDSEEKESWYEEVVSPVLVRPEAHLPLSMENPGGSISSSTDVSSPAPVHHGSLTGQLSGGIDGTGARRRPRCSRATSCPPSEDRKALSGPWSWEWLRDHNHEEAGVIFSARKRVRKGDPCGGRQKQVGHPDVSSRKAGGGVLRHPVHSLKKIARLPTKDRGEALKALGRCVHRRRAGDHANESYSTSCQASSDLRSASGTSDNDWRNWVAVHGNDQLAMEDIRGIGQTIGVTFRGDVENMFSVLTRTWSNKGETSGHQKWKGSQKEKRC